MSEQKINVGWWEWVALPEIGLKKMKAKVDSGAATSCLHATEIKPFDRDGRLWVSFIAHGDKKAQHPCEFPVFSYRKIKSSNGQEQFRYVIRTHIIIGEKSYETEFTLTRRNKMKYRALLGRLLLAPHCLIECDKEAVCGTPQLEKASN